MKKLLALILCLIMAGQLMSFTALADFKDSDMAGVPCTYGVGTWQISFDTAVDQNAVSAIEITNKGNFAASKTTAALYKMNMPDIPDGKVLGSAEFRVTSYYSAARPMKYAYKFPEADYDMSSFTIADALEHINPSSFGTGKYYLTQCIEDAAYASGKTYRSRYNVTDYIKECLREEREYFWIAVTHSSANTAYPHDSTTDYWRPKLFYTVEDAPEFKLINTIPENGNQAVSPSGIASFVFSSPVADAVVTVNGIKTEDFEIDEDVVNVNYTADENSPLEISVTATDEYKQPVRVTASYRTSRNIVTFDDTVLNSLYCIGKGITSDGTDYANESSLFEDYSPEVKLSDGGAVFYELPLPVYDQNKYLSSYKMNVYTNNANANIKAFAIPAEYNAENGLYIIDEEDMSLNESKTLYNVADIFADYEHNKAGDVIALQSTEDFTHIQVELTSLARERIENGDTKMIVALTTDDSDTKFSSHQSAEEGTSVVAEIENNPKISVHGAIATVWGCELTSASFGTYTDAASVLGGVAVTDKDGIEVSDAEFVYNPHSNKIELKNKILLNENSSYSIVIKSGTSDSFGNTLSAPLTVTSFETGKNIPVTPEERLTLWEKLVSGSDAQYLADNWSLIVDVFGFEVEAFEDIDYMDVFFNNFVSNDERSEYIRFDEENVKAVEAIIEEIATEVATLQKLLKSVSQASHISVVGKIITDDANAKLLGIEEYVSRYNGLYSTDYVDTELTAKTYRDAKEFRDVFVPALEYAESIDRAPSSGGGGGGGIGGGAARPSVSGSATVGSFVPTASPNIQTPAKSNFNDISSHLWANDAINYLAAKSLINGKADGVFAPADNVTRAEFTAMIVRAFGFATEESKCDFDDVNETDWFYSSVASGVNAGIINGNGNGFAPFANITREDMAVIIYRAALKYGISLDDAKSFADSDSVADYAKDAVSSLGGEGIVSGLPEGTFEPKKNLTRAEAAVVICKMIKNFIEEGAAR